jgi:hypothetical protein
LFDYYFILIYIDCVIQFNNLISKKYKNKNKTIT